LGTQFQNTPILFHLLYFILLSLHKIVVCNHTLLFIHWFM